MTRREILTTSGGLFIPKLCGVAVAAEQGTTATLRSEHKGASLLAVSPNGKMACIGMSDHPVNTFRFPGNRAQQAESSRTKDLLRIVEVESGHTVGDIPLREKAYPASFFMSGSALFADTASFVQAGRLVHQQVVVTLNDMAMMARLAPRDPDTAFGYHAVGDEMLLVQAYDRERKHSIALVKVHWPDLAEKRRVDYATRQRESVDAFDFQKSFAADRRTLAYAFDHTIVFRETGDLGLLWERQVDTNYLGAWRLAVSSNGQHVAAAITDSGFSNLERRRYIAVYDGSSGRELTRLDASGTDGLAISPDGRLVAAARVVHDSRGAVPTVSIYSIVTGNRLAGIEHTPVAANPFMNAAFGVHGVEFTADGLHLITSTLDTRIWALSKNR